MSLQGKDAIPAIRPAYPSFQLESELVVAIFRTALIILAVLMTLLRGIQIPGRHEMQISVAVAAVYNVLILFLYWRRVRIPGQRQLMLIIDVLFVMSWVYLTWQIGPGAIGSPLFPFFYILIIISSLWFGVSGSLISAGLISVAYLLSVYQLSGYDSFALIDSLYREVVYLFLVAIISGYVVDTHKRERDQWARSQVLLAQYQERFRAAQEMYELLIPQTAPETPGLEFAARWRPALQEGGGDFYDAQQLDSGKIAIIIADVSGKFTRSALKLPLFKAAFLACVRVWEDPGRVLAEVNRIVYPLLQPDMFVSACVIIVDPGQGRLLFANAGQDPPLFVRKGTREIDLLETGGLVLGVDECVDYQTEEKELEPGDIVCLYTDGITEARNLNGDEFGYANLEARVQAGAAVDLTAEELADNIFDAVHQHSQHHARQDDMTLVIMRFCPLADEGENRATGHP